MTTTASDRHTAQTSPFAATRPGERREAYAQLAAQAPVHRIMLPDGEPATVDLIDSFAFPLPMAVIGRLLGVPPGDMSRFRSWSRMTVNGTLATPRPAPLRQPACSATYERCSPSNAFRRVRICSPHSQRFVTAKTG